jgi:hypothetical protein
MHFNVTSGLAQSAVSKNEDLTEILTRHFQNKNHIITISSYGQDKILNFIFLNTYCSYIKQ